MAAQPEVFVKCLQQAAAAAGPAMQRSLDDAVAAIQFAESMSAQGAEREQLGLAWRGLMTHQPLWCARYPERLQVLFASCAPIDGPDGGSMVGGELSPYGEWRPARAASLSLVDDADVSRAIESSRLAQQVRPAVESLLGELDKLMSSVRGLSSVRPDMNPLQPEVFVRALQELMAEVGADPALVALWVRHLGGPFGRELGLVYEQLINLLEMSNVRGASYRVTSKAPSAHAAPPAVNRPVATVDAQPSGWHEEGSFSSGPAPLEVTPQPVQYADLSNFEIREELFQEFLFNGGKQAAARPLAPTYYDNIEEELKSLKAAPDSAPAPLMDLPTPTVRQDAALPGSAPRAQVDERTQLNQQVWGPYGRARERAMVRTQLKKEAQHVDQVLGLEVVRKVVGQVAQDPRLLVPVREAIVALEPSLLRLAMVDPRFFSDERHAGRRLLERVAQRSFKYNDTSNAEFRIFLAQVTQSFRTLNEQDIEDFVPFVDAMAELERHWSELDKRDSQQRDHIVKTMRFAEDRQLLADRIAKGLSERSDLDKVHRLVLEFILGPWALVMAHARLTDTRNQIDPRGFGSVVPDLVWSVKREVTLRRPSKLFAMIPGLLARLNEGLTLIGQDPRESDAFFEALMKLHRPVLKLRRLKTRRDAEASGIMPLEGEAGSGDHDDSGDYLDGEQLYDPDEASDDIDQEDYVDSRQLLVEDAEALPWMGRDELHAAGFEDTVQTDYGETHAETQDPMASQPAHQPAGAAMASMVPTDDEPELTPAHAEQLLKGLRTGDWVDLHSRRQWLRAQLIWVGSKGTLFMFLSHGGQPHSMTKRSCERLIRERLLRPVDSHGVVEQALDAVVSELAGGDGGEGDHGAGADAARLRAAMNAESAAA